MNQAYQNIAAEQSVLGACLLSPGAINEVADLLSADDFAHPPHAQCWQAIMDLLAANDPIDELSVIEALRGSGRLVEAGGALEVSRLTLNVPSALNVQHWARMVRDTSRRRQLRGIGESLVKMSVDSEQDLEAAIEASSREIVDLANCGVAIGPRRIGGELKRYMEELEERYRNRGTMRGLPTGLKDVDAVLGGLQGGDLVIIAARPSMGKTALAVNIGQNVCRLGSGCSLIFSQEMQITRLLDRIIATEGMVDITRLSAGSLQDSDWPKLSKAANGVNRQQLWVDDQSSLTVIDISARARRHKQRHGLDLVIVDYIQIMRAISRKGGNRERDVAEMSQGLKDLAKSLDIPVVALSQLNRGVESRPDKRPMLSDLRESGAIEQDADVVMTLYRDDYYNKNSDDKGLAELSILKNRNGATRSGIILKWMPEHCRFLDYQSQSRSGC